MWCDTIGGIMDATNQTTQQRYGKTRNTKFSGKIVVIVLSIVLAATLAYIVAQLFRGSAADVTAQEAGGQVISDNRLSMNVDVTRDDPEKAAFCIVTALDYDKSEVGRREFVVPAGGERVSRYEVQIDTRKKGYAGTVYGCSTVLPKYLNPETGSGQ